MLCLCLVASHAAGVASTSLPEIDNVIFMILDGVGAYHYALTRLVYGELNLDGIHELGWMTTHSANADITESPAAATALATGHKTNNVMVSIAPNGERLKTVLEYAQDRGMRTGLITTVMIYDATPAAFAAHNETRYNQAEIAAEMIEQGADVLLGGGWTLFYEEDLVSRAEQLGYAYVEDEGQMHAVTAEKLLGLFAPVDMSFELDRHWSSEPSIAQMTEKAIEILSADGDAGFFLMVEGGKTDWAGHRNDAASIAADLKAFDDAVGVAIDFADANGNTLIVITSDHETGGLTFAEFDHAHIGAFLAEVTASADYMGTQFDKDRTNVEQVLSQHTPICALTHGEVRRIQDCGSGFQDGERQPGNTIATVINGYARTSFSATYHTSANVPLFWYGAGAFAFSGICDNTDVGRELIAIVTESGVWGDSAIEWDAAADHAGTRVSVSGPVASAGRAEGTTYINLGNAYLNDPRFDIVIPPECEDTFATRFGERPAEYFDQKRVVVYGEVELSATGIAYMTLRDPYAIRVVADGALE